MATFATPRSCSQAAQSAGSCSPLIPRASVRLGQMAVRWGSEGCRRSQPAGGVVHRVEAGEDAAARGGAEQLGERLAVERRQHQRPAHVKPARAARAQRRLHVGGGERRARPGVVEEGALAVASVEHHGGRGELVRRGAQGPRVEPARPRLACEHAAEEVVADAAAERGGDPELHERRGGGQGAAAGVQLDRLDQRQPPLLGQLVHGRRDRIGHHDARAEHLGMRVRRHGGRSYASAGGAPREAS